MPWYIYSLAAGSVFYPASALLALSVILSHPAATRVRRAFVFVCFVSGLILIAASAAALPIWFYTLWVIITLAWLGAPASRLPRIGITLKWMLLAMIAIAVGVELDYAISPRPVEGTYPRLYVIGDSVSAGIGAEHGLTWPVLIRNEKHVEVIDLSRAGATLATARKRVMNTPLAGGLMLLEIGGNDMFVHVSGGQFAADLQSLIGVSEGPGRRLVMLELPLLPLDTAYGIAQRRICREHHITLIPRRLFIDVLKPPGATVDGIHLTAQGQRAMGEMIWHFIAPCVKHD